MKAQENKAHILVFGGTSEGRRLVEWLAARGTCRITACSATEYGACLLPDAPNVEALARRMDAPQMRRLMQEGGFSCVVDATHPFAREASENIAQAAAAAGLPCLRLLREGTPEGDWTTVEDAQAAALLLAQRKGNVLLTTGSKELAVYTAALPDFAERLYVRVLPLAESLAHAARLGIPAKHVIAMQGPHSAQMNAAIIREFDIRVMVTKASGAAGGFWEKAQAARDAGAELVVIHAPAEVAGLSFSQVQDALVRDWGI